MCYTTRMLNSTTNEETPRPEPKPATGWRDNRWNIAGYGEEDEPTATGYEADEEHLYYWDQHAEG